MSPSATTTNGHSEAPSATTNGHHDASDAEVTTTMASRFAALPKIGQDPIFELLAEYGRDADPRKVNLGIGVYRTEEGAPWPLPSVRAAEDRLHAAADPGRHDYLAIAGDLGFLERARDLLFGLDSEAEDEDVAAGHRARIASVQTISGTGANHLAALFLARHLRPPTVWLSDPTWANHHGIWELQGVPIATYPYYDATRRALDFDALVATLEAHARPDDVLVLQACAHNPTGLDPSPPQWRRLADLVAAKRLYPFFDCAYQGFASGDPAQDAWPLRHFLARGLEMSVAQSFAKNFGLYGQRVGAFHHVLPAAATAPQPQPGLRDVVFNNLCQLIRGEYSMAPRGGAELVRTVLADPALRRQWLADLTVMSGRIKTMRRALYDGLARLGTPGSWKHIVEQIGMFSYLGLTPAQMEVLKVKYHVYGMPSGRASISGLNSSNVQYVAEAIDDVVRNVV